MSEWYVLELLGRSGATLVATNYSTADPFGQRYATHLSTPRAFPARCLMTDAFKAGYCAGVALEPQDF